MGATHDAYLLSAQQDEASAQVLLEALIALAFGRDIVLSQSYVIDSYSCQLLIATVMEAQRQVSEDPGYWLQRPRCLRLHLHGVDSFPEALAGIFSRIASDRDDAFQTSLYPDLQGTSTALEVVGAADSRSTDNPIASVPGYRADLFQGVWDYFRSARKGDERFVVTPAPRPGIDLDTRVCQLRSKYHDASTFSMEHRVATALGRLLEASSAASPFKNRSKLHLRIPWDAASSSASAAEIVGDQNNLALAREVVDTLYNRVVVASIGMASASYSTAVGDGHLVASEFDAQALALEDSRLGDAPFELSVHREPRQEIDQLIAPRRVQAFAAVLKARDLPDWQASLTALDQATSHMERGRRVKKHARLLAELLAGVAQVQLDTRLRLKMHFYGAAASATSAAVIEVSGAFNPMLGGMFSVATSGYAEGRDFYQGQKAASTARRALGQLVGPIR